MSVIKFPKSPDVGEPVIRPIFLDHLQVEESAASCPLIRPIFLDHLQVEESAASCPLSTLTELAYSTGVRFRIEE